MNLGLLKEDSSVDRRAPLTPSAVESLVRSGCAVFIESGAGDASRYSDGDYREVGGTVVYSRDEVFGRSDVLLKISSPTEADSLSLHRGQTLFSFLHFPVARPAVISELLSREICTIAYERIEDASGDLPILMAMSELAGRLCIPLASRFLESTHGGRGIILGGVTGIPPATVVIIGAGTVGATAARMALGSGAEVIVLDRDMGRLRRVADLFDHRVVTATVTEYNLRKALRFADVVIGAVLIKGERTPHIVTEEMVAGMKPGALLMDVSIDQGGCFETSRPTTTEQPTFVRHGVTHFCVPNIPAMVARSATQGITNALLPYLLEIAGEGLGTAIDNNAGLAKGVCTRGGSVVHTGTAGARHYRWVGPIPRMIGEN